MQHLLIGKAQYLKTQLREQCRAARIVVDLVGNIVSAPIGFNYQPGRNADEVHDVEFDGVLAAKFCADAASPQFLPQRIFCFRGLVAHCAGTTVQAQLAVLAPVGCENVVV